VAARTGDAQSRRAARERLEEFMSSGVETWVEAWCRAAIGRSLVLEDDREQRLLGVVSLLHVPARLDRSHPYLAGLCLAEAALALADLGDAEGAERLRRELGQRYPDHPVLTWAPIRDWRGPNRSSSTAAGGRPTDRPSAPDPARSVAATARMP
jgi:hypothetical protein